MNVPFVHPNLPMLLLRASDSVARYFRPLLRRHGLTDQKWRILRALGSHGELEIGRICELCALLGPSLTGILERMERDGLITRQRPASDQRKVVVGLTPRGQDIVNALHGAIEAQYEAIEQLIGIDDLAHTYALMDRLIQLPEPVLPAAASSQPAAASSLPAVEAQAG